MDSTEELWLCHWQPGHTCCSRVLGDAAWPHAATAWLAVRRAWGCLAAPLWGLPSICSCPAGCLRVKAVTPPIELVLWKANWTKMATLEQPHQFAWRGAQKVQRLESPSWTGRRLGFKKKKKKNPRFELKSELWMLATAAFTRNTASGKKSTCESFSRQLPPSFPLCSSALCRWPAPGAGLPCTFLPPRAEHLLGKHHHAFGHRDFLGCQRWQCSPTSHLKPSCGFSPPNP